MLCVSLCFARRCPDGFHPAESTYICMADRQFLGFPPICEPLLCSFGLPETVGVNSEACVEDIRYGQSCEVVCAYGFEGESSTYQCVDGVFQGIPPSCVRKACQVPSDQGISSCEGVLHGQSCLSTCNPGFTGAATQLQCEDGSLQGLKPNCTGALCSLEGIPIEPGLDATECLGKSTSESCSLKCERGYSATGNSTLTCQPNGRFRSEDFRCLPKACGNLSAVPSFSSSAIGDFCSGIFFGQTCVAFCQVGWQIEGNASILVCDDVDDAYSQGFVQFFPENRSYVPAAMTQPPTCTALVCTDGLPSMKGVSHDCQGKTTGETCQVGAQVGYFADPGPTTLTCQSDGQFVGGRTCIRAAKCEMGLRMFRESSCIRRFVLKQYSNVCWLKLCFPHVFRWLVLCWAFDLLPVFCSTPVLFLHQVKYLSFAQILALTWLSHLVWAAPVAMQPLVQNAGHTVKTVGLDLHKATSVTWMLPGSWSYSAACGFRCFCYPLLLIIHPTSSFYEPSPSYTVIHINEVHEVLASSSEVL